MRSQVARRSLALLGAFALVALGCGGEVSSSGMSVEASLAPEVGAAPTEPAPEPLALEPLGAPAVQPSAPPACESDLAISSVSGAGRIVILADRTTWEVDQIDRIDTRQWSRRERILLCGKKMTNLSRGDEVNVFRVQ